MLRILFYSINNITFIYRGVKEFAKMYLIQKSDFLFSLHTFGRLYK